ncbi:putative gustatory receptor 28b [Diachasma alloeum]|uniref:Gustatory receptor n=1 Tax=Diachasma alloeum TaxID=454923 RepID=A0A4E0S4H8_9HYME|nr:putative gustatory receptor 28b [Diachasma alloeum]THK33063.1 gustatory receptor 4 [Diachasma alloeum]
MSMNSMENMWLTDKPRKLKPKIDLFSMLDSVALIWQFAGNFPMRFPGHGNVKKCCFSRVIMGYQIILFFTCVALISTVFYTWEHILRSQIWVMTMVTIVRTMSCLLCMLINCFMWMFYRKDFIDAMDFLASQSVILNQLGCRPDYSRCLRMIQALVYGMLTILLMFICYDFFIGFSRWPPGNKTFSFIQWLFWTIPLVVQVMTPTIFVALVMILGLHFRQLNVKLMAVRDRSNSSPPKIIEVSNEGVESIRLIAKVHYNLCKISKFINSFFSANLVVIVVMAFFVMSSSLYFIFNEVVKDEETDYWDIGTYVAWEITTALPIIVTVVICNLTSNEAELTGRLIHELYVENSESKLYQIIRSLSLQLHHQKIEFSGAGLFPINSSLLQTMIGNMTTFLVILIQFQPSLD